MKRSFANIFTSRSIFFFLFLLLFTSNSYSQSLTAEQIYKKVSDAVVVVHAYDENNRLASQGSGVVLNDKGYVVTNYHVLSGNDRLEILHGKQVVPYVDIIGIDVEKDILILKIDAKRFPAIEIGDSRNLNIGQRVYAIGSPLGLENSISEGIISGLRSVDEAKRNFIQITASISPGSSSGAIVNDKGELIGISTLTFKDSQNLNFAIPIEDILNTQINNNYSEFYFDIAISKIEAKVFEEALKYLDLAIEIKHAFKAAYKERAKVKSELKDITGAIKDLDKLLNLDPLSEDGYYLRGKIKNGARNYRGAIKDYNKVIELNPNNIQVYKLRGIAKYNASDKEGACSDWFKAKELGSSEVYELIQEHCK